MDYCDSSLTFFGRPDVHVSVECTLYPKECRDSIVTKNTIPY